MLYVTLKVAFVFSETVTANKNKESISTWTHWGLSPILRLQYFDQLLFSIHIVIIYHISKQIIHRISQTSLGTRQDS